MENEGYISLFALAGIDQVSNGMIMLADLAVMLFFILFTVLTNGVIVFWFLRRAGEGKKVGEGSAAAVNEGNIDDSDAAEAAAAEGGNEKGAYGVDRQAIVIGRIIGNLESILIIFLVVIQEITALSLIFTAKSLVRREDVQRNPRFFLLGTLVNFVYSIMMGFIALVIIQYGHGRPIVSLN